jgi:hypothetical protein
MQLVYLDQLSGVTSKCTRSSMSIFQCFGMSRKLSWMSWLDFYDTFFSFNTGVGEAAWPVTQPNMDHHECVTIANDCYMLLWECTYHMLELVCQSQHFQVSLDLYSQHLHHLRAIPVSSVLVKPRLGKGDPLATQSCIVSFVQLCNACGVHLGPTLF